MPSQNMATNSGNESVPATVAQPASPPGLHCKLMVSEIVFQTPPSEGQKRYRGERTVEQAGSVIDGPGHERAQGQNAEERALGWRSRPLGKGADLCGCRP